MLDTPVPPQKELRPASSVMRLRRMGASFPTRLSFMRSLLRAIASEGAMVTRPVWDMCPDGFGHAVYTVQLGGYDYSLVAVSTDLPDDARTDRVIATAWDTAYVLYDGVPTADEVARIVRDAPHQEASRFTNRDLVLSRANKSVRLFSHVVDALRSGVQPDRDKVLSTGYLMRTTAVYGNGKFGIADRDQIADRPHLSGPFAAEMLTVLLIRGFTHNLVEHIGGAPLDRDLKRALGIGNATGLGMAPFLVSHPLLLDAWMQVRETALARVRAIPALSPDQIEQLYGLVARAAAHLAEWNVPDPVAMDRIAVMRAEWATFAQTLTPDLFLGAEPIDTIVTQAAAYSVDTQELIVALMLEPFGDLIDGLTDCMATPFVPRVDPLMTAGELKDCIAKDWDWAINCDYREPDRCARFWYVSAEKQEPRIGDRHGEPGADQETPLDIARQVKAMALAIGDHADVGAFLRHHPEHRNAVCRVQTLARHPYAEIRDNLIAADCLPINMLRCKLAFFGAAKFDPKSDLWTRITLAQGAPLWDELENADDWWLPSFAS